MLHNIFSCCIRLLLSGGVSTYTAMALLWPCIGRIRSDQQQCYRISAGQRPNLFGKHQACLCCNICLLHMLCCQASLPASTHSTPSVVRHQGNDAHTASKNIHCTTWQPVDTFESVTIQFSVSQWSIVS